MSENNKINNGHSDEIDLLDLFVILLRYRLLILGAFSAILIIAVIGYFIYPSWKYNSVGYSVFSSTICRVADGPAMKAIGSDYDLGSLFRSSPALLDALKKAGYESIGGIDLSDEKNRSSVLNWLEQNFLDVEKSNLFIIIDENYVKNNGNLIRKNPAVHSQMIRIIYQNADSEKAELFLTVLFESVNAKVLTLLTPQLQVIVDGYEQLLSIETPSDSLQQALVEGYADYEAAKNALNGQSEALVMYEEPYSIVKKEKASLGEIKSSYKKKAFVAAAAILLLSILLAFILNIINSVRQDEEAMAKIRTALNRDL